MKKIIVSILNRFGLLNNRYLKACFHYDFEKFGRFSGMGCDSTARIDAEIRILCHTIEKGLSLSNCRADFGQQKIEKLLAHFAMYQNGEDQDSETISLVESTLSTYVNFRKKNGLETPFVPKELLPVKHKFKVGAELFSIPEVSKSFSSIARARHSIRNFSARGIETSDLYKAVAIAQTAPSACNRQATRIYACINSDKIEAIKQAHGGIRSFGHPGVIFAIAQDLNLYINEYERNTWLVDAGIFCMNLLYALQSVGFGACPVIWGGMKDEDDRIMALLGIPANERIAVLVVAGYPPEEGCKHACSPKRPLDSILRIVS